MRGVDLIRAAERNLPLYSDCCEMLDDLDVDILAVFDVDSRKCEAVVEGLRRGKHVICDKPICTTLDHLDQIRTALAESDSGSLAMLVPFPFLPLFRALKDLVDSGDLGDIVAVRSRRAYIQKVASRPRYFFTKEYGGGILCDIGTHDLDTVRWLLGGRKVVSVSARATNGKIRQFETGEDYSAAIFELDGGVMYTPQVDRISPINYKGDASSLEVFGTKGQAIIPTGFQRIEVTVEGEDPRVIEEPAADVYPPLVKRYLDCLDAGTYNEYFFAPETLESVHGVLAAQLSADRNGEKIKVD